MIAGQLTAQEFENHRDLLLDLEEADLCRVCEEAGGGATFESPIRAQIWREIVKRENRRFHQDRSSAKESFWTLDTAFEGEPPWET